MSAREDRPDIKPQTPLEFTTVKIGNMSNNDLAIKLTNNSECPEDLGLTSGVVCEVCNAFCSPVLLQGVNEARYKAVQCLQRAGLEAPLYN